jgi:hypothetical protein
VVRFWYDDLHEAHAIAHLQQRWDQDAWRVVDNFRPHNLGYPFVLFC